MIVRIVKMNFQEGKASEFVNIFHDFKGKIRDSRGCIFVELLNDSEDKNTFMTYSVWSSEEDLDRYRHSEVFKEVWSNVKVLFDKEPEARTMLRVEKA